MKTRLTFLFVFLSIFLLTSLAFSGRWAGQSPPHDTFSFDGSTTSTSSHLPGMTGQAEYWEATGSASISGTATELGQDRVYKGELWLMATGDIVSSPFPDKGNIAAEAGSDGSGAKQKIVPKGDASILYRSHPVGSMAPDEINFGDSQVQRTLSRSLSESYSKRSYSSPTGLCASPEVHGELSGTLMNFSGSQAVSPLSFQSKDNKACADSLDDGTEVIASEKCFRQTLCLKPGTATALYSHRVECDKDRWVDSEGFSDRFKEQLGFKAKKVKEKCDGEWWTCDDELDVCDHVAAHIPDSESHLEEKYVDSNGNTVDPNTVTRPCGHLLSASGDHSLQASCSVTNNRWQRCTVTNFYACQSHTHTYRTMPCPRTLQGGASIAGFGIGGFSNGGTSVCSKGGYLTTGDNHRSTCRLRHSYWDCDRAAVEQHKVRTCARCSNTYQNCEGASNPCTSSLGHTETVETPAEAPSTPQPDPSPPSETPPTTSPEESDTTENEGQETEEEDTTEAPEETAPSRPTAVCGSGHTYFTDVRYARNQHQDRTCLRCSQTYQKCSNHATACQNRRWHTQDDTSYMEGACGHSYRINEKSQHASVTCTTTNANGDRCNGGSYYACQSHTHTYPAPTPSTPTPTPSPPENSNPNDNENEEEETEEEVPTAPPAPTISYHPCGQHPTTASGVHSLQASCSETNSRGDRCTATSFYQCQHSSHTYPAPTPTPTPTPPTTVTCGAASWTGCTADVSSSTEHNVSCRANHSYWTCGTSNAWHASRTCTRCGNTYSNCDNSATACQSSKWHTETPQVVLVACGAASWTGCTSQLTSSTAHQVSCSSGHSYWTCGTAVAWHKDRTCSPCRQTYQNCSNSATACQGSRWHRE